MKPHQSCQEHGLYSVFSISAQHRETAALFMSKGLCVLISVKGNILLRLTG
jgi:hypothetical protein